MSVNEVRIRDASGKELHVLKSKGDVANFGRDKRVCHVAFDPQAARVSRVHASIEWSDEGIVFTDKSKEGTMIDGTKQKQSSTSLDVGLHQVQIGGIELVVEVEGTELEETVLDSPSPQRKELTDDSVVEETVANELAEECDEVSSMSTSGFPREKRDRKRKSDVSLFDESQPRGKRGPVANKQANFDEEMENRGKKGPRARKAVERDIFEDETPAKKMKPFWAPVPSASQRLAMQKQTQSLFVDPGDEDEVSIVASKIAAIPSVSSKKKEEHADQFFDRGPFAPNETIKYANLIFRPSNYEPNDTTMTSNVPNFKKFKPKNIKDGRVSVASMASNSTFHTTISLVDARQIY